VGDLLYPENDEYTWLIARSSSGNTHWGDRLLRYLFYEVPHFIMERKMFLKLASLTPFAGPLIMLLLACMAFGGILQNVRWRRNESLAST
jgi:hypothetical protein